ncbi:ATP-binding protein [Pseudomonas fluorescens]|uniref:ATP-binding protein n=1 Tax=Pseudomonas fluorescens TaxID=294 RepID=A0A7Z6N0M6_PSEFL|nr:ATP-binding protein [Pseudomonas fluorescens]RDS92549.1 hypothetical protein DL347_05085 [Pseudomonas fluorescens]
MKPTGESFKVDTKPSKEVVVDSLIRDISIEACIFDLVDNCIDAARDTIYKLDKTLSHEKPPPSYEKFKIDITTNGDHFIISDNCGGITQLDLATSVLRFGQRSSHDSGIGVFGVGLNRAIFKLGRLINLDSDTGIERCTLDLDTIEYIKDDDWDLPATKLPTQKKIGTTLTIEKISSETSRKFSDKGWQQAFSYETGRRYGKFIEKGLEININGSAIESQLVRIRSNSNYETDRKFFKLSDDISVHIEVGQHEQHKFSAEADSERNNSRELTPQYGWTIFCNDRAVIVSDQSWKTGWNGKFHSQFYGFVGNVNFYCSNPEKLPWSTTKTDVDLNNPAYQTTLEEMKKFSTKWRAFSEKVKDMKRAGIELPAPQSAAAAATAQQNAKPRPVDSPNPKPVPAPTPAPKPTIKKPTKKIDHNTFQTILPQDIDELYCNDKHLALVHEAKSLSLNYLSYSGLVLIRILFEVSSIWYLRRKSLYAPLKKIIIAKRNLEREKLEKPPLTKTEEGNASPTIDEVISYFESNEHVWDDATKKNIKLSLKKFAQHKEKLNSAVHSPFQPISKLEAFQIRDEVLPILRYLIETKE